MEGENSEVTDDSVKDKSYQPSKTDMNYIDSEIDYNSAQTITIYVHKTKSKR